MRGFPKLLIGWAGFRRGAVPLALASVTAGLIAAVATHRPLANGPAEWQWAYRPADLSPAGAAMAALALAVALAAAWGWPARGKSAPAAAMTEPAEPGASGAPALFVIVGGVFTLALVAAEPGGFGRVFDSLVSRNSFGYVWDAGLAPPARELLADYPAASSGLNQHSVTHPPGPLLAVRALDLLGRRLREPAPGESGLAGAAARAITRALDRAHDRRRPVPEPPPSAWTLVALAFLLPALSALAGWPLYRLALLWGLERSTALLAALLWVVVPARSLFTPSFDQALPAILLPAAVLATARGGQGANSANGADTAHGADGADGSNSAAAGFRAFGAGVLAWLACFLSYGCLAFLPLLLLLATLPIRRPGVCNRIPAHSIRLPALLAAGFLLPWLALAAATGFDAWSASRAALALHHKIAVAPRSYATWLLFNPYDFALLLGPALLGLSAAAFFQPSRPRLDPPAPATSGDPPARPRADEGESVGPAWRLALRAWWVLLAVLLLSGGARGEVGRIWLPWMPFACLFAAAAAARWGARHPLTLLLVLLQAALLFTLAANLVFVT
jgi:hypothetical protein